MGNLILSVLVPCYRASATLTASIKSALRDLPHNSEVLIYLDGLDAKASKAIELINDNRIRVVESHQNRGEYHARNMLVEHARGDYVANLDSDDITLPKRFLRQIKLLEAGYGEIVFSNAIHLKNNSRITTLRPLFPFSMSYLVSPTALALYNPFVNSTMACRMNTVASLDGFRSCTSPDYEMWIRAATKGIRIARDNKYGVLYRVHDKQMTQSLDWQKASKVDGVIRDSKRLLWQELGLLDSKEEFDIDAANNLLKRTSKLAEIELFGMAEFLKKHLSQNHSE